MCIIFILNPFHYIFDHTYFKLSSLKTTELNTCSHFLKVAQNLNHFTLVLLSRHASKFRYVIFKYIFFIRFYDFFAHEVQNRICLWKKCSQFNFSHPLSCNMSSFQEKVHFRSWITQRYAQSSSPPCRTETKTTLFYCSHTKM